MKKFLLYLFLSLGILAAIFAYILYTEGAFQTHEHVKNSDLKPFISLDQKNVLPTDSAE